MTQDTAGKTVRDREATKGRLVQAVGAILSREGFGSLGINSVAQEAGVDKVLIYRYFGGMPQLLRSFGQSADFWPSVAEVVGSNPEKLMELSLPDRWALGLSRYAAALRRRPITKEILAWEQIEKSELCEILREAREQWFQELMSHFQGDAEATDADLVSTVLLIVGAIHYFVVLSRLQSDFSGVVVDTDQGWDHLDSVIATICRRTFAVRQDTLSNT